jgi:hypothetical protein
MEEAKRRKETKEERRILNKGGKAVSVERRTLFVER